MKGIAIKFACLVVPMSKGATWSVLEYLLKVHAAVYGVTFLWPVASYIQKENAENPSLF